MRAFEFIYEVLDTTVDVDWSVSGDGGDIGRFEFDGYDYYISVYPILTESLFGPQFRVGFEVGFAVKIHDKFVTKSPEGIHQGNKVFSIVYNTIKNKLSNSDLVLFYADDLDGNLHQRAELYSKIAKYSRKNYIGRYNNSETIYCLAVSKHNLDNNFKQNFYEYMKTL